MLIGNQVKQLMQHLNRWRIVDLKSRKNLETLSYLTTKFRQALLLLIFA